MATIRSSLLLLLILSSTGLAQNSKPKQDCHALISATGYEFSIDTAILVPAAGETPEFCLLTGQVIPEVRFELSLPTSWNGRLYMFGNGGFAGEVLTAGNRVGIRNLALKRGFAVAQTNTGHDATVEPLGTFAVNRQKLIDYAYRAVHVTALTAKRLAQSYYDSAPVKSYFQGCSTGGRQGLISAQRFPEDFDGIVVGAPVLDFTGTMTNYSAEIKALSKAPIPLEKMKIVAHKVYEKCDALDGLTDGLITDPRRCQFDASRDLPHCDNDTDGKDCFTTGQLQTLETIYRGAESGGKRIFWGQPVGAEIEMEDGNSGWNAWIIGSPAQGGRSISGAFAETFFRYLAFPKPDPTYDLRTFNLETDLKKLDSISALLDAKNPDLSRFKARGGKIVMYFGWADPALNPLMGVDYFEKVAAKFGSQTSDFFRLFMVPGMTHCRGGVGCDDFDAFSAVFDWVEKGNAPKEIVASQRRSGKVSRTRPLCPYPQAAKYKGTGNVDDAGSFSCVNP